MLLAAVLPAAVPGGARAADAPPERPLQSQVEALLRREGLTPEHVALLLYSTRQRRYLAAVRHEEPMVAASNMKLVTTFAALRVLGPNYRWRTRLSLVEENDGPAGQPRQGLLIEGGGDPTLTGRGLEAIALRLKAEGVRRLDGPLYLDGSLFDDDARQDGIGPESPLFVPLSPFVVENNAVEFTITLNHPGSPEVLSLLPPDAARVVSRLQDAAEGRSLIRVEQGWNAGGGTFTLSGVVTREPRVHTVSTSVSQPGPWFYHWFRSALRRMGIEGDPALQLGAPNATPRLLFTWLSPPLREAIMDVDKNSNNLGAELLVRALGQTLRPRRVTGADGMQVVRGALAREFPGMEAQYRLADGSGLSRNNQVSPLFLVRLLNRALRQSEFRSEFVNALAVAGWDGTLRYRDVSPDLQGRLRAKTGTLNGVSNLSGYLTAGDDTIVFSFLINDSTRPVEASQAAQDQVLTGVFEALTGGPKEDPAQRRAVVAAPPQPPAPAPGQRESLAAAPNAAGAKSEPVPPPPASPKPKRAAR